MTISHIKKTLLPLLLALLTVTACANTEPLSQPDPSVTETETPAPATESVTETETPAPATEPVTETETPAPATEPITETETSAPATEPITEAETPAIETESPATVDVLEEALDRNKIANRLQNMPYRSIGSGCFDDYVEIHQNPTTIANLPLDITAHSRVIAASGEGISAFTYDTLQKYGFRRDYANPSYTAEQDLEAALTLLFTNAKEETGLAEAKAAIASVHDRLKPALADFLSATAQAYKLYATQARLVNASSYRQLTDYVFTAPATSKPQPMTNAYTISRSIRQESLLTAGLLMMDAAEKLTLALNGIPSLTADGSALTVSTPAGDLIFGTSGNDTYQSPAALLLIDPQGDDTYNGKVAASISKTKPISVLIDCAGSDTYTAGDKDGATQGSGILGAGILFDLAGNDTYTAVRMAQGFALHGTGILFDGGGNDTYESCVSSQSCAHYGYSLLADAAGDDTYRAYGYAQASAGNRALSFLVDREGNDTYTVEPYVQTGYLSMDYGQFPGVSGNWSQGCGAGNRSVSTNERGLAGGIAGLIDHTGDDHYVGGIWVQGVGYWSGIGFLSDLDGADNYHAMYYSQSSVAHYGIAMLLDIGGDDKHLLNSKNHQGGDGAGYAFVWDRGVALFVNDGGNDQYTTNAYAFASAWSEYDEKGEDKQDLTYAFFLDTEGKDRYSNSSEPAYGSGLGGFFFDLDGKDTYLFPRVKNDKTICNRASLNGVFLDRTGKEGEPRPVLGFWENAKEVYLNP